MFMKYSIVTRIYTEILINQAVDNFTSSRFRESRFKGIGEHRECYENPVRRFGTQRPQVQILSHRFLAGALGVR